MGLHCSTVASVDLCSNWHRKALEAVQLHQSRLRPVLRCIFVTSGVVLTLGLRARSCVAGLAVTCARVCTQLYEHASFGPLRWLTHLRTLLLRHQSHYILSQTEVATTDATMKMRRTW